jgi:three-Cys-motif partner protein
MPIRKGVGYSDVTPYKQKGLRRLFAVHLKVLDSISKKWDYKPTYLYIDATSGLGKNPEDGCSGSPLIFLEELERLKPNIKFKIYLIEKNPESIVELQKNIKPWLEKGFCIEVITGKYQECIIPIIQLYTHENPKPYGIIYIDENGVPDFDFLQLLTQQDTLQRIDVLFNYPATSFKREKEAFNKPEYFKDKLDEINKKFWQIRKPMGHHQWTFLFGCNLEKLQFGKSMGFFGINSFEGKDIFRIINLTREEYQSEKKDGQTTVDDWI